MRNTKYTKVKSHFYKRIVIYDIINEVIALNFYYNDCHNTISRKLYVEKHIRNDVFSKGIWLKTNKMTKIN